MNHIHDPPQCALKWKMTWKTASLESHRSRSPDGRNEPASQVTVVFANFCTVSFRFMMPEMVWQNCEMGIGGIVFQDPYLSVDWNWRISETFTTARCRSVITRSSRLSNHHHQNHNLPLLPLRPTSLDGKQKRATQPHTQQKGCPALLTGLNHTININLSVTTPLPTTTGDRPERSAWRVRDWPKRFWPSTVCVTPPA